MRFTAGLSRS